MRSRSREFPLRFCNVIRAVQRIVPKPLDAGAPPPLRLDIVLEADPLMNTLKLRDSWLGRWSQLLPRSSTLPCNSITLRALHPLLWDEHLVEGLGPLRKMYSIQLEHTTRDGKIRPDIVEQTQTSTRQT